MRADEFDAILNTARLQQASLTDVMQAVVAALLYRWTRIGALQFLRGDAQSAPVSSSRPLQVSAASSLRSLLADSTSPHPIAGGLADDESLLVRLEEAADSCDASSIASSREPPGQAAAEPSGSSAGLCLRFWRQPECIRFEWSRPVTGPDLDLPALAESHRLLMQGLTSSLDLPVGSLSLVSGLARAALLAPGRSPEPTRDNASVVALFAEQVALRGPAVAVQDHGRTLSYDALDREANRLAHVLMSASVNPGDRVGICLDRGADLVAALLAVLKCGAAYVPLDAEAPQARLAHMASDTGMHVVVTDRGKSARPGLAGLRCVCVDDPALHGGSERAPSVPVAASDLAYVMYTSGSTGLPKGVAITHRGIVQLVKNADYAAMTPDTVMAQAANIAFDAATFEIWGTLCNGGRLVVMQREEVLDAGLFSRRRAATGLNSILLTTSVFNRLVQAAPDCFAPFGQVLFGGEQASLDAVRRVFEAGPPARLVQVYGPTENTTFSTCGELRPEHVSRGVLPIGPAVIGTQCYVVSDGLELQPDGAIGELLLSGDALAVGYWGRPELTAERFIDSPPSWGAPRRLYRTGDLVRRLPSGELVFVGRIDTQVKLRGFRIETGEIEQVLIRHAAVKDAAVIVRNSGSSDTRYLAAYWVRRDRSPADPATLREYLALSVPDYMLPAAFVCLESLPLTANGKLDRKALPAPLESDFVRAPFEAPRPGLETRIAQLWARLLRRGRIGRHDSFIELGGQSLLLARLIGDIRSELQVTLPYRAAFEAATVAAMATLVERYGAQDPAEGLPEAAAATPADRYPLSYPQQSLLFIDRLHGGDSSYNLPHAFRLRGPLDTRALQQALQAIVERHHSLRTVFRGIDGSDWQSTLPAVDFPLAIDDWAERPVGEVERELHAVVASEGVLPFDLGNDVMLRARLIRLSSTDHVLLLTLHHIAADGWSVTILLEELSTIYRARTSQAPAALSELSLQYADYARWQRDPARAHRHEKAIAYWQKQLAELPPSHELPLLPRNGAHAPRQAGLLRSRVAAPMVERLVQLGLRQKATLFMTVQAAFAVLLHRWTGATDIIIGTPAANRDQAAVRHLIGYFVNPLVLRNDLSGNPAFLDLLGRTRDMVLEAFDHQSLPFERLVEAIKPPRDPDSTPLFQVMLAFQNPDAGALALPGVAVELLPRQPARARFDLTLNVVPSSEGLDLEWEYRADRLAAPTVAGLAAGFEVLLAGVLAQAECPILELPVLTEADHGRLVKWSTTAATPVPDAPVHRLFEAVATAQPNAIALRHGERCLTYRELDRCAERRAHALRAAGILSGDIVGLCGRRNASFIISVLALWKLGAAYLPLDPEQPASRLAYLVTDAGLRHVVSDDALRNRLPDAAIQVVCVDADQDSAADTDGGTPMAAVTDDASALAYVIYTSGSTGEPKGVLVEHRAVSRLLGEAAAMGYSRDTVMLQSVNAAFDASVLETWGPLCRGGQLVLCPEPSINPAALEGWIAHYAINTVTLPAAVLEVWVEQLRGPCGLSRIVVGGEALSASTVARLFSLDPRVTVINHYGPTENGILTSYYPIPRDFATPIPIGRAVPGTALFVLNEARQLQPPGATGELYVAGQGLARGYLGRPALTDETFVAADPALVRAADGTGFTAPRWYRTGDRVRWLPAADGQDAVLQFVGRCDQQVKIRGFRIEPGEIEAQLRRCEGVADARVVVRTADDGQRQLVAYVIAHASTDRSRWRAQLEQVLPAYMVPSAFVCVDAWPLSANGKVDLRALPAPDRSAYATQPFVAAETPLEMALLTIWQALLKLDRISIDDNFFELGGQSLLATRLHNRIKASLGVEVPLRALFEAQTIRRQAAALAALEPGVDSSDGRDLARPRSIPPAPVNGHVPLTYAQQRLWFIQRMEGDTAQYHIPLRLRLRGALDLDALCQALRDLVQRHAVLRTRYREVQGEPAQVIQPADDLPVPLHDLSALDVPDREAAAVERLREEALRPFDLAHDAMLRACVIRLRPEEHWLAITVHHIAADGWSMGILQEELAALYEARRHGRLSPLPALTLQYADYAHWQRRGLDDTALEPHFRYWQERLRDLPVLHALPIDRPRPAEQTDRGALLVQQLDPVAVARFRELLRQHDATLFMGLHSVFAVLLARFSGETDIVVGTPVANRRDDALSPLVGLFINTLVFRSDLSADPDFIGLLAQSRRHAIEAFEHQDLPFELLVERINPPRSAAYSPLFQILFALQNNESRAPALPGLEVSPIPFDERLAKFDLALNIEVRDHGLQAEWEYNADLFDRATIEQMASAYARLLDAIVASPDRRVSDLPLLDGSQQQAVLALGNDTARDYPVARCVHELVEQQVARQPQAIAVLHEGRSLTYSELNREANRLAHHLRSLGVTPDVRVAISMERGPSLVIALLAILKAGGAYVPMDPGYPEGRLQQMLEDSAPAVLIVEGAASERIRGVHARLQQAGAPHLLDLASDAPQWAQASPLDPARSDTGLESSHLAYVIYTSGSTGKPKGVMNEHRGIANRLMWLQEAYPLAASDRFLQTASFSFGAAVVEIFWPLIAGARLVLVRAQGHKDASYLIDLIGREQVTVLHFVPSMLRAFLEHARVRDCRSLRRILCGGELLSGIVARRCRALLPQARLHHFYGCSEAAVLTSAWECAHELPDNIPIGTPGANTRVYILDSKGRPVPRGVRGEIHVAGRQVARGYLNRADLTAERFVPDPFDDTPGARMVRTGDLGRQLADGSVEYLGRRDFQVKIRGQRVEPGDIEAHLLACEGVRQAVVVARGQDTGDTHLVAYAVPVEPAKDHAAFIDGLRQALARHLPPHMVPATFMLLPALPLNANGKLDRAALPVAEVPSDSGHRVPPGNELQQQLLTIWQELLKRQDIGIGCDFFARGGHSLLVLRLGNRLLEAFDHELDMKAFFAEPTVRALADAIDVRRRAREAVRRFHDFEAEETFEF